MNSKITRRGTLSVKKLSSLFGFCVWKSTVWGERAFGLFLCKHRSRVEFFLSLLWEFYCGSSNDACGCKLQPVQQGWSHAKGDYRPRLLLWLQAATGPSKGDYRLRATTSWGCYRGCRLQEKETCPGPWSRPPPSWRAMMDNVPEPTTHFPRSAVEIEGWQLRGRGIIRIRLFSGGVNGAKEEGLDSGTKLGGS